MQQAQEKQLEHKTDSQVLVNGATENEQEQQVGDCVLDREDTPLKVVQQMFQTAKQLKDSNDATTQNAGETTAQDGTATNKSADTNFQPRLPYILDNLPAVQAETEATPQSKEEAKEKLPVPNKGKGGKGGGKGEVSGQAGAAGPAGAAVAAADAAATGVGAGVHSGSGGKVKTEATLVICPLVAVLQWASEIEKYTQPGTFRVSVK